MAIRTRDDLARVMAPKMGMTHQDSRRYLDLFLEEITKALRRGRLSQESMEARKTLSFPELNLRVFREVPKRTPAERRSKIERMQTTDNARDNLCIRTIHRTL
jgi:hypothetical protein